MTHEFNPEVILEHNERGAVAQTVATPGYAVIHRIQRAMVDRFISNLMNVSEDDEEKIVAKHRLAKAAAQFFQMVTDRVNHEIQQYHAAIKQEGPVIDVTEGMIDLGPKASTFEDVAQDGQLFTGEGEEWSE